MITRVTRFKCSDGSEFKELKDAEYHNGLIQKLKELEKEYLRQYPYEQNSSLSLQQKIENVIEITIKFLELLYTCKYFNWLEKQGYLRSLSIAGRAISDGGQDGKIFYYLYNRICSIDARGKEFSQPYFANTSNEIFNQNS